MALSLALALVVQAAVPANASTYERTDEGIFRLERGSRFEVDPEVITVRFTSEIEGLDAFLERLTPTQKTAQLTGLTHLRTNRLGISDLKVAPGTDVLDVVAAIRATGLVDFAEENTIGEYVGATIPNDPNLNDQWSLFNLGQTGGSIGADVNATLAWNIETGDPSVTIAIVDSGTDVGHEDLRTNSWRNLAEIPNNGVDDDNNGFIDDVQGWDFADDDNNPVTNGFHGTFVAGCVAARTGNGKGIAGLAGGNSTDPGCSMMPCAVGAFSPQSSVMDEAIIYAADNGARVITMSLSVGSSTAIDAALDYAWNTKGVFVNNASGNGGFSVGYPSTNPNVVAIGGTTNVDTVWSSSNKGPEVWVCAPSVNIYSTDLGGTYSTSSGTSFASPRAAATVGLIFSLKPNYTHTAAKEILKDSAIDIDAPGFDNNAGWGRIDAYEALVLALESDCDGNGLYDAEEIAANASLDLDGNNVLDSCESLTGDVSTLSVLAGGSQSLDLDAGVANAGSIYWVLGSVSGTSPGFELNGVQVPLNVDAYTGLTLNSVGAGVFGGFLGLLDGSGQATASFNLPAGTDPTLAGLVIHHAATVAATLGLLDFASNAVEVELVP